MFSVSLMTKEKQKRETAEIKVKLYLENKLGGDAFCFTSRLSLTSHFAV